MRVLSGIARLRAFTPHLPLGKKSDWLLMLSSPRTNSSSQADSQLGLRLSGTVLWHFRLSATYERL